MSSDVTSAMTAANSCAHPACEERASASPSTSVVLVGAGAIGSVAVGLLAKVPGIDRIVIIDHDRYEPSNRSQDITPDDVGQPKALVQAGRVHRLNPAVQVVPIVAAVERVPLGVLRTSVVLCAVDARAARVYLNGACTRLGTTWIDAGVQAEGHLARINVYAPGRDNPCLECAFDDRDYALLEQTYPCEARADTAPPTNAPAALGALAAALQVLECEKLLAGRHAQALVGRQVLVDAAWHKHYVTTFRRNPACRLDHATWEVETLDRGPDALRIRDALAFGEPPDAEIALGIEGQMFVGRRTCPRCGEVRDLAWRLSGRVGADELCMRCGAPTLATGCDVTSWLGAHHLPAAVLSLPLSTLGVVAGDILTVRGAAGERHLQVGVPAWGPARVSGRSADAATEGGS